MTEREAQLESALKELWGLFCSTTLETNDVIVRQHAFRRCDKRMVELGLFPECYVPKEK